MTGTRAVGAAAIRNAKRDALCTAIEQERVYVLSLCVANPEQAQALILAAGMHVAAIGDHSKALLGVLLVAGQPGRVMLKANRKLLTAGRGAKLSQINWRYTVDGGKTYVTSTTPLAKTTLTGLPSMTTGGLSGLRHRLEGDHGVVPHGQCPGPLSAFVILGNARERSPTFSSTRLPRVRSRAVTSVPPHGASLALHREHPLPGRVEPSWSRGGSFFRSGRELQGRARPLPARGG